MYNTKLKNTILDNSNFHNTIVNEGNYLKIQELGVDKSNLDLVEYSDLLVHRILKNYIKKVLIPILHLLIFLFWLKFR